MKNQNDFDAEPIHDVPPPMIAVERPDPYGTVPGLDKDELADPQELARMIFKEEWGPILDLPDRFPPRSHIRPERDTKGHLDWGAFGTVDFERLYGEFDKPRHKADRLWEDVRQSRLRLHAAMERLPGSAKYEVLRYFRQDVIELDHITDDNMRTIARMDARIHRQLDEIRDLREYSRYRQNRANR